MMVAVAEAGNAGLKESQASIALKTFISGGIAGCCAKTSVAPLDRVKILLQVHNEHYKHLGVFSTLKHVVQKEGLLGLYQGNGVQMIRIFPYASIQFLTYEQMKKVCKNIPGLDHASHLAKLISGSVAGLSAVCLTYPLDMIRARLAFQVRGEAVYTGILDTVKSIHHLEGGIRGLYQGIVPSILGMAPYAGLSFSSFEFFKQFALEHFPNTLGKPCPQNTGGIVLILPAKLLCGGLAGATAQTISYPLDVVRRKMQISGMLSGNDYVPSTKRWYQVLVEIYQEKGLRGGLYRGMSINYIRIMPTVAISFATYESAKQILGLDTGLDR